MEGNTHNEVESVRRGRPMAFAFSLIVIVLVILVLSTWWFMGSSQKATETSVQNVSKFYLQELSEQTARQLENNIENQVRGMEATMHVIHKNDQKDLASLQAFLSDMSKVHQFDFLALVDRENMVYTQDGILSGKELGFLGQEGFTGPDISVHQTQDGKHIVLIAIPIDALEFEGTELVAGIIGIKESAMSERVSLRNDKDQIFSNIIKRDGTYVVATPHMHLQKNDNVFDALSAQAVFPKGYSAEQMKENIQAGKSGITLYYLDHIMHYTYYAPAEGTDWYLTTTIHYGTVSRNVEFVRNTITRNSMIQLVLMMLAVCCVFLFYFRQWHKNETLRLEKVQAEENSKAKSRFLSNMSHDIRTPMNAVIGFTELAISHEQDAKRVHEYLLKIRMSGRHLLSLINDVLDMSRIESGKMQLDIAPHSLPEILSGVENIVQGQAQERRQVLQVGYQIEDEAICCDRLRLNQVLLNLLGNAVKFTPEEGTVSLHVVQNGSKDGKASYEFHVKDNGIGMTPEFAQKVFAPFEREQNAAVHKIQGTGLGMAITKSIVDLMGGSIRVETQLHKGTEFIVCVDFPIHFTPMCAEGQDGKEARECDFKGRRILLAEDNELNREIATEILCQYGFKIETAEDGAQAVEMLKQAAPGTYDLILMDVQMPVMDGYTATREIRGLSDPKLSGIPIVAMTANAFEEDKKTSLEHGMDGHVTKPIDVSALLRVLSNILE